MQMLGWNAGSPPLLSGIQGAVPSTSADFVVEALISGVEAAVSFSCQEKGECSG